MNKEQHIEELHDFILNNLYKGSTHLLAEKLYNAGYRKTFTSDLASDTQEQIEEITKERNEIKDIMKLLDKCVSLNPMCKSEVASVLYGNNYRKLPEDSVVLSREEYEMLKSLEVKE